VTTQSTRPHIVVVGSTIVDLLSYTDRVPEQGQTMIGNRVTLGHGGKGANQAVMAARLGARVTFVSRVGADMFGEITRQNLIDQGLSLEAVKTLDGESTGVASIWIETDGHNRILAVPGANLKLSAADVAAELDAIPSPDCVVCQLEVSTEAVRAALEWGRSASAITILNPAPMAPLDADLLAKADWLVPNEIEFRSLFGGDPRTDQALIQATESLTGGLIVTLGADGAATVIDGGVLRLTPPSVETVDTTGAGDAFMGALAYALSRGDALADAIALANLCGAMSTAAFGTQPSFPDADDVLAPTG
jgi:ribokinase